MYYPHINLLRAFAAFSVIIYHLIEVLPLKGVPHSWPWQWFHVGWLGVDVFFVISGFVIMLSAFKLGGKHDTAQAQRIFMRRRIIRIVPLYFCIGILFILFSKRAMLGDSSGWTTILAHIFFLQNLSPHWHGAINGPTWTLAAEMQFYLLVCLCLPWLIKLKVWHILAIFIPSAWLFRVGVLIAGEHYQWAPHTMFIYATQMPMMLDLFGFGMAGAMLLYRKASLPPKLTLFYASAIFLVVSLAVLSSHVSYWNYPLMVVFWRTLFGLAVIAGLLWMTNFTQLPSNPVSKVILQGGHYLGDISYGLYLWHMPVLAGMKKLGMFVEQPLLFSAVMIIVTICLSAASWHLLERPCMKRFRKSGAIAK